jgi:site-specific recombinase XerD
MDFRLTPQKPPLFPDASELAAVRAWFAGLSSANAVARYLPVTLPGQLSARSRVSRIRRQLAEFARSRQRTDLAKLFEVSEGARTSVADAAILGMDILRNLDIPNPQIYDEIDRWLSPASVAALKAIKIATLADLTVRIPRRKQWWVVVPGLGVAGAKKIELFFAEHPDLTRRAHQLITVSEDRQIVPWELLRVPSALSGARGKFRTSEGSSTLEATNDYEAVNTWIASHEVVPTQRSYRKEAERFMLWSIIDRGKALSSLTAEDAIAYRAFLRRPTPAHRWVGVGHKRTSEYWKPFTGPLESRSIAYALTVIGTLFRYLINHRYVLANPFAGLKVRGGNSAGPLDSSRFFSAGEWGVIRAVAEGLEWSEKWEPGAAARLRFALDFAYTTGLRSSELVRARLGDVKTDTVGDHWLAVTGKGSKAGLVVLPPMARSALDQYLLQRNLAVSRDLWKPKSYIVASLDDDATGITSARLWAIFKRFFEVVATKLKQDNPELADKVLRASPHWMRHSHATNALADGVALTSVRDNLRHSSINTTSVYLHTDKHARASQLGQMFK